MKGVRNPRKNPQDCWCTGQVSNQSLNRSEAKWWTVNSIMFRLWKCLLSRHVPPLSPLFSDTLAWCYHGLVGNDVEWFENYVRGFRSSPVPPHAFAVALDTEYTTWLWYVCCFFGLPPRILQCHTVHWVSVPRRWNANLCVTREICVSTALLT
jgi:hypothetical protein